METKRYFTDEDLKRALELRALGHTNAEIAEELDFTKWTIWKHIGAEPGKGSRIAKAIPMIAAEEKKEESDVAVHLSRKLFNLKGCNSGYDYTVDTHVERVTVIIPELGEKVINFEDVDDFIATTEAMVKEIKMMKDKGYFEGIKGFNFI